MFTKPMRIARVLTTVSVALLGAGAATVTASAATASAADSATIDGSTTYQTIDGFGSSEAFGQAASVMKTSASEQQQIFDLLYSRTGGAGLDILRNEISADPGSTIEPNAPSGPSAAPTYVPLSSINQDQGQLWFAQRIKANYGVSNVFADAWSAPAFMKTNNSTINGGALCGVPGATCSSGDWRQAYADYLVQYGKDYAAAGVPLTYLGPENEANLSTGYDSMQLTPAQTANVLDVLGPTLAAAKLPTKAECCATEGWDYAQQYAAAVEADTSAASYTPLFTSHGYTQAPTTPLSGWNGRAWETEWFHYDNNGWDTAWDDASGDDGLTWAQHIHQGLTGADLNAFLFWYGTNTPDIGGNGSFLMLNADGTVSVSSRLWAFANYSRFIRPGATRIGAATANSAVELSAYKNTDGSLAIVALNTGTGADPITYALSGTGTANGATVTPYLTNAANNTAAQAATTVTGATFSASIPARSLVTYVIAPGGSTGNTVTVANPGNQTGTVGIPAGLQIKAADSAAAQTLTYHATGLPTGLALAANTGSITGTPSAPGTYTVTVTATDATGAAGSTTFTWTINPAGGAGTCKVGYSVSQWTGGFVANLTITNTGTSPINGWNLSFTFPGDQKITNAWNGTASQTGQTVTLANASWNATIAPGSSATPGFQGTWSASDATPTSFSLNGSLCTAG